MKSFELQSLESRMLRAAVTAVLSNGKLTITGTDQADSIYLYRSNDAKGNVALACSLGPKESDVVLFDFSAIKSVYIDAKGGNDTVVFDQFSLFTHDNFSETPTTILGGDGNDTLNNGGVAGPHGTGGLIDGGAGNDTISGLGMLEGGAGNDTISGLISDEGDELFNVSVSGGDGNDLIDYIGNGSSIDAGAGNDTVYVGGVVTVHLGDGNDKLYYTSNETDPAGTASIYGDAGADLIEAYATSFTPDVKLYADGGADNDTLIGTSGGDTLKGSGGDDQLHGGGGNDVLDGGTGNDILYGDAGNDALFGSDGNDTLYGGSGNNKLYGQGGKNLLNSINGSVDTIYGSMATDVLQIDKIDVLSA